MDTTERVSHEYSGRNSSRLVSAARRAAEVLGRRQVDGQFRSWGCDSRRTKEALVRFKKKRIMIPLLGLVAIIALASGGSGSTEAPSEAAQSQAADTADQAATGKAAADKTAAAKAADKAATARAAAAVPVIGSKVLDGKFEFVVTKVERIGKSFDSSFGTTEKAQGEFIIVRVNVKNVGQRGTNARQHQPEVDQRYGAEVRHQHGDHVSRGR